MEDVDNMAHIEHLLSEKLLEGYVLLESTCPACSTPLVKNNHMVPKSLAENGGAPMKNPVLVSADSFDKPFKPVQGVPVCVVCQAHVVTRESEISILERCESLKDKGSILLALNDPNASSGSGYTEMEEGNEKNPVVISVESSDHYGEENVVEVLPSPKSGDELKPIVIEDADVSFSHSAESASIINEKTDINNVMEEYSIRREIATKVLGAKMLQGYTLKESTCERCSMPLMENKGKVDCVVCPVIAKKARKIVKDKKRIDLDKSKLDREIAANNALEKKIMDEHLEIDRRQKEERLRQFREEEIERERLARRKTEVEEEREKLLAMEKEEEEHLKALEEEENRLLQEARERAAEVARREAAQLKEDKHRMGHLEAVQRETKAMVAANLAVEMVKEQRETEAKLAELMTEKQRQMEEAKALMEEKRRIDEMDTKSLATKSEHMKKDLLEQEHRRRLHDKARLDEEISKMEEERRKEEIEVRKLAEEKRALNEAKMIAALEADAAAKALAAEEAIRKAKKALEAVHSTKRDLIAQTIAMAEKEAIAETEKVLMAEREDYKEKVILPSESQLQRERWETLRMEGRAIMTRRVLQGWQLLPEACKGSECEMSPLITKFGRKECVVCGGTGTGEDGVYGPEELENEGPFDTATIDPELLPDMINMKLSLSRSVDGDIFTNGKEEEFEQKRDMVSKEIGKRMLLGWTLLDASCPQCVMPLMMDNLGNMDICVLCGPVGKPCDASTIKTNDVYHKSTEEPVQEPTDLKFVTTSSPAPNDSANNDALLRTIQEQARMQNKKIAPRTIQSDPPALTKGTSKTTYALADLSASSDTEDNENTKENEADNTDKDAMTTEMIAKMFLRSPHGYDFHDIGTDMTLEEIKELVDIFMVTNFNETVPDDFKYEVAQEILNKIQPEMDYVVEPAVIFDNPEGIIRLDDVRSPTSQEDERQIARNNYHFDAHGGDTRSVSSSARRARPSPETAALRHTNRPPKPPRAGGNSRRDGAPIIVGGPLAGGYNSRRYQSQDNRSIGGNSRASSVASDALESIYARIDHCKAKLMDPNNSIEDQLATAGLMEKLAKAAVAMKAMESIEDFE